MLAPIRAECRVDVVFSGIAMSVFCRIIVAVNTIQFREKRVQQKIVKSNVSEITKL